MSDARETANCSFKASLLFKKRFPDAVRTYGRGNIAFTSCTSSFIGTTKQKNNVKKIEKIDYYNRPLLYPLKVADLADKNG